MPSLSQARTRSWFPPRAPAFSVSAGRGCHYSGQVCRWATRGHMRTSTPALPVTPKQDAKPGNILAWQRLQRAGPAHCGFVRCGALDKSTSYWPCPHICGHHKNEPHRLCAKGSPYISASCPPPPPRNTPGTGIGDRRLPGTGKGRPSHHPPTWSTACLALEGGAAPYQSCSHGNSGKWEEPGAKGRWRGQGLRGGRG